MTEAFPLSWPIGRGRTSQYLRKHAPFKTTPGRARDELLHQLKLLGANNIVISSNVATYRRGGNDIPYADQSAAKDDPGVAVYYAWKSEQYSLCCDKYNTVMDNMQALMKTVDAIRGIERWGTGEMMKAAFAGFKALPEQTTGTPWWDVLQCRPDASEDVIRAQYKRLAMDYHPDKNDGDSSKFIILQQAYQQALKK